MLPYLSLSVGLGFLQVTWFFSTLYLWGLYLTLFFTPIKFFNLHRLVCSASVQSHRFKLSLLSLFLKTAFLGFSDYISLIRASQRNSISS